MQQMATWTMQHKYQDHETVLIIPGRHMCDVGRGGIWDSPHHRPPPPHPPPPPPPHLSLPPPHHWSTSSPFQHPSTNNNLTATTNPATHFLLSPLCNEHEEDAWPVAQITHYSTVQWNATGTTSIPQMRYKPCARTTQRHSPQQQAIPSPPMQRRPMP